MLKKVNRIGKRKEFEEIKARGKLGQTPLFGYIWLKKDEGKRFGMVISKKISKKAVERHRVKRLLAEGIRKNLEKFPEGVRIIFLAKPIILKKNLEEIENEVVGIKVA